MGVKRAKVRAVTALIGDFPPTDDISLKIDQVQGKNKEEGVHVGGEITGTVITSGKSTVHVVFEGIEYTVVAFPGNRRDDQMGIEYLRKHTSQRRVLIHEERTIKPNQPCGFRFGLPDDLPGTLRCVLDGSDPVLPSQCQIKYSVTATIYNDASNKAEVCAPIIVLPKKDVNVPIDPMIEVSIDSSLEALFQSIFTCGGNLPLHLLFRHHPDEEVGLTVRDVAPSEKEDPVIQQDQCILLLASRNKLILCPGQKLEVHVKDWFRLLSRRRSKVWMIKLTEEWTWRAHGRTAFNHQSWDLYANHHELPVTLMPSYDSNSESLLRVRHELAVYMTTSEPSKALLASTGPIQVRITSGRHGWGI